MSRPKTISPMANHPRISVPHTSAPNKKKPRSQGCMRAGPTAYLQRGLEVQLYSELKNSRIKG